MTLPGIKIVIISNVYCTYYLLGTIPADIVMLKFHNSPGRYVFTNGETGTELLAQSNKTLDEVLPPTMKSERFHELFNMKIAKNIRKKT